MTDDAPRFLIWLADVGRNSVIISVYTKWVGRTDDNHEVRSPDLVNRPTTNEALYSFDMAARDVMNWKEFYQWLGGGQQWRSFTLESARELVPHWLGEQVKFECATDRVSSMLVKSSCYADIQASDLSFDPRGIDADVQSGRWLTQIMDNMVLMRCPIFVG